MSNKIRAMIAVFAWSLWVVFVLKYDALLERAPGLGLKAFIALIAGFFGIFSGVRLWLGGPGIYRAPAPYAQTGYSGKDRKAREKTSLPRNKLILPIFILSLLLLISRLSVLFSYLDGLYETEELYRGTIAREIIRGPLLPLWEYLDYRVEYFPGGTLVVGILAVPFFLLFGQTYIALKLVGLTFALGTFIFWYVFMDRFFSRKAAIITGLLFIFCMPFYTKTSLITWGAHPETNFFTIAGLFIFCSLFFGKNAQEEERHIKLKRYFLLWGVVSGFGVWFMYSYLLTILLLFAFWFVFDKRFFLRTQFFVFGIGFLIGFSPEIYYRIFYGLDGMLNINGASFLKDFIFFDIANLLPKMKSLLTHDIPHSLLFRGAYGVAAETYSYVYYSVFMSAFLWLAWLCRRQIWAVSRNIIYPLTLKEVKVTPSALDPKAVLLAFPVLFSAVYSVSGYAVSPVPWDNPQVWLDYIGYRYMIPLMPFFLAIMGVFFAGMKSRRLFHGLFSLTLIIGLIGNLSIVSWKNFGRFSRDKGYSYNIVGDKIGLRITSGLSRYIEPFEKLEGNLKIEFYEGMGSGIAWRLRNESPDTVIDFFNARIKKERLSYLYRGWGMLFFTDYPDELDRGLAIAGRIQLEYLPFFYEGLARYVSSRSGVAEETIFLERIEKKYWPYCYKGVGYSIGFEFHNDLKRQERFINEIDARYRVFVREGAREGMDSR